MGLRENLVKFNDGGILSSDPWRITQLELLGLAETEDEAVLQDPGLMVQIASEYAFTGLRIVEEICSGAPEPALSLITRLSEHTPEDPLGNEEEE
jgi:hypothetical protein